MADPAPSPRRLTRRQSLSSTLSRRGARILVLCVDNQASRLALRMAAALLRPHDELQVVTVVSSEDSRVFGEATLAPFADAAVPLVGDRPTAVVLVKGDSERLSDTIAEYAEASRAELVVCGSHHLCVKGTRDDPLPASGSFCLRLAKCVRCCPLLVVKCNSTGHYLAGTPATGLRVMVDCQSNTRHLLSWLMGRLDPEKDLLFLAVGRALDQGGGVREVARRMLTNFTVQASVSEFDSAQRTLKEASAKALPQAARTDMIDILALTAPPCKTLPQALLDVLTDARTAVLIYNSGGREGGPGGEGLAAAASVGVGEGLGVFAANDLAAR